MNLTDPRFKYVTSAATPTEGVLARWLRQVEAERQAQKAPHVVQMRKVSK